MPIYLRRPHHIGIQQAGEHDKQTTTTVILKNNKSKPSKSLFPELGILYQILVEYYPQIL